MIVPGNNDNNNNSNNNNNDNKVFDFLGGHHEPLRNDFRSITSAGKELSYLIECCQKWILSQIVNTVRNSTHLFKRKRECTLM